MLICKRCIVWIELNFAWNLVIWRYRHAVKTTQNWLWQKFWGYVEQYSSSGVYIGFRYCTAHSWWNTFVDVHFCCFELRALTCGCWAWENVYYVIQWPNRKDFKRVAGMIPSPQPFTIFASGSKIFPNIFYHQWVKKHFNAQGNFKTLWSTVCSCKSKSLRWIIHIYPCCVKKSITCLLIFSFFPTSNHYP